MIIFNHIPKTAGTALLKNLFEPNLGGSIYYFRGFRPLLRARFADKKRPGYQLLHGHVPYSKFFEYLFGHCRFVTMLRHPLERAVSYYYFVRASLRSNYRHPDIDKAMKMSLKEFYRKKIFYNLQTRYIAGYLFHRAYRVMPKKILLHKAKTNLEKCFYFGISERLDESLLYFEQCLHFQYDGRDEKYKVTLSRPKLEDLDRETYQELLAANDLDLILYDYATDLFDKRLKALGG